MNEEEMKRTAYLEALRKMAGMGSTPPAQVADTGGVISDFIKKQRGRGGGLMEPSPTMDSAMSEDPYDLLRKQKERDEMAGRIFTPGQGWKTLPRG